MSSEKEIDETGVVEQPKPKKIKLVVVESTTNKESTIKNKGTGAGGSTTNKNGLSYEEITKLDDRITIIEKNNFSSIIKFNDNKKLFTKTEQANLFKCMKDETNTNIEKAHGCKNPDECYIDKDLKNMFIIEKKFQQCSGSVSAELQQQDEWRAMAAKNAAAATQLEQAKARQDFVTANEVKETMAMHEKAQQEQYKVWEAQNDELRSVCEKIQTPDFKLWQYSRTFQDYTIIYIFCLSDWFKKNCIAELEYLDFKKIPYFWGSSETYKDDIINFILNYK